MYTETKMDTHGLNTEIGDYAKEMYNFKDYLW